MDISPAPQPNSYDQVAYQSMPYRLSHPAHLATVARLAGLSPTPVASCRVLELGCASGGNLIPLAEVLPESTFVGVDLSVAQVKEGRRVIETLGLKNIELLAKDIQDLGADFGTFDYVIAHGLYSWVPPHLQDRVLAICATNLKPNGVAYVSYNTLPGWRMRGVVRDLMSFHGRRFANPRDRVEQGKALLTFVVKALEGKTTPYANMLRDELKLVQSSEDWYLLHDHLEAENHPFYFHEFIDKAKAYGLQYLGEADISTMAPRAFPADVQQVLKRISPDTLHLEQYMDFLRNREFRQTLLCRGGQAVSYQLTPDRAREMFVACRLRPAALAPDITSQAEERFQGPGDSFMVSRSPITKAALVCLAERWPTSLSFPELCSLVAERLGHGPDSASDQLRTFIFDACTRSNAMELSVMPPPYTMLPGERPEASPLARLQAQTGNVVTNLRHETVQLTETHRQVLVLLDGTLDREGLANRLEVPDEPSDVPDFLRGEPLAEPVVAWNTAQHLVNQVLPALARAALLIA